MILASVAEPGVDPGSCEANYHDLDAPTHKWNEFWSVFTSIQPTKLVIQP